MASLTDIRLGLAANLAVLNQATGIQVLPYLIANPTPPTVLLFPVASENTRYDLAMGRGLDQWDFAVQAFVGATTDIGAQATLDKFIASSGPLSIKAALEKKDGPNGEVTLGGLVSDVNVTTCTGYRIYLREGGGAVLGAEWTVEVWATGT
jgi:hypothetical protein